MSHQRPTASKSALLLSPCLRSFWAGAKHYDDDLIDTTKREAGTAFHKAIDEAIKAEYCPEPFSMVGAAYRAYRDAIVPRMEWISSEVAMAGNFHTGEAMILQGKDRDYTEVPEGWFPGTADLVGKLKDGRLYIADWKTGGSEGAAEQLASLAWMASRLTGVQSVLASVLSVDESGVHPSEWGIAEHELSQHGDAISFALDSVGKDERRKPVPGPHCISLYCPHLAHCPATMASVEPMIQSVKELIVANKKHYEFTEHPSGTEHAGYMAERITAIERAAKYYKEALKAYIKAGGKVVSGQYEWADGNNGHRWRRQK